MSFARGAGATSPNQVLTHAARAAAKQLNGAFSGTSGGRARRARRALVRVTQQFKYSTVNCKPDLILNSNSISVIRLKILYLVFVTPVPRFLQLY